MSEGIFRRWIVRTAILMFAATILAVIGAFLFFEDRIYYVACAAGSATLCVMTIVASHMIKKNLRVAIAIAKAALLFFALGSTCASLERLFSLGELGIVFSAGNMTVIIIVVVYARRFIAEFEFGVSEQS